MTDTHVFLGPSLPAEEAIALVPDAVMLPPVQMGDVYTAVERGARTLCIIDGYFHRVPAVWHKEILYALSRGVRVIGAASMGALRASELHTFGMQGIGAIFEAYRDGILEDDDEVALLHGDAESGFRALSEPLVNIRFALDAARARGVVTADVARTLVSAARERFYPERSWHDLLGECTRLGVPADEAARLRDWLATTRPNVKRDDARLALAALQLPAPPIPSFDFEPTVFWNHLVATTARAGRGVADVRSADVLRHAHAVLPDIREVHRQTLLNGLLAAEAERLGIAVSDDEVDAAVAMFRRERGLATAAATTTWLEGQGLTERDLEHIGRLDALLEKLLTIYMPHLACDEGLAFELRRQGRFESLARQTALNQRVERSPASDEELIVWYRRTHGPLAGSLEQHARRRGFESSQDLLDEIAAMYVADPGEVK